MFVNNMCSVFGIVEKPALLNYDFGLTLLRGCRVVARIPAKDDDVD